jgi:hypothetical protein
VERDIIGGAGAPQSVTRRPVTLILRKVPASRRIISPMSPPDRWTFELVRDSRCAGSGPGASQVSPQATVSNGATYGPPPTVSPADAEAEQREGEGSRCLIRLPRPYLDWLNVRQGRDFNGRWFCVGASLTLRRQEGRWTLCPPHRPRGLCSRIPVVDPKHRQVRNSGSPVAPTR